MRLCAHYLLREKKRKAALDPVAKCVIYKVCCIFLRDLSFEFLAGLTFFRHSCLMCACFFLFFLTTSFLRMSALTPHVPRLSAATRAVSTFATARACTA